MEEKKELSSSNRNQGEMVQVFMVVRCYSCGTFQVHQVKKINKWQCKVCSEKQSIQKVYGKGAARDCRKHVQKLNMARGENERSMFRNDGGELGPGVVVAERAGRERSMERERERGEGVRESYPPSDYANAFNTQNHGTRDAQDMHPVMLAGKGSKWTTFIEPHEDDDDEDDDGAYTTDRNWFSQASKNRHKTRARRSMSERKPSPPASHDQTEKVCPYSSVNRELFDDQALELATTTTTRASVYNLDRYTRLDASEQQHQSGAHGRHSKSMFNLSSIPHGSPSDHKEQLARIKQDLEQFSRQQPDHQGDQVATDTERTVLPQQSSVSGGGNSDNGGQSIPKISSRWSQFMCEEDSESDADDGGSLLTSRSPAVEGPDHSVHILASKSTISKFTLVEHR